MASASATRVGTGFIQVNSVPYAHLTLNGKDFEDTPRSNVEVPAGEYTIRFECATCDPPQVDTFHFTLEPGGRYKKIHKFSKP